MEQGRGLINSIFGGGSMDLYVPYRTPFKQADWKSQKLAGTLPDLFSIKGDQFKPYFGQAKSSGPGIGTTVANQAAANLIMPLGGLVSSISDLFGGSTPSPREMINSRIKSGNLFTQEHRQYEGFQPSFYDQRAKDYENFAMPQLAKQYQDAFRSVMYNLGNRGLTNSSAATRQKSDLNLTTGQARQQIADTGIAQAQQLRGNVENARQNALSQLMQTGDLSGAMQGAVNTASSFQQPSTFAPIANMFSNLANQYYMNQVLNNYRGGSSPMLLQNPGMGLAPLPQNQ